LKATSTALVYSFTSMTYTCHIYTVRQNYDTN